MFFRIKQRTGGSYKCLSPDCTANAAPTYRNRVCAKHKGMSEDRIQKLLIARDNERRKEDKSHG